MTPKPPEWVQSELKGHRGHGVAPTTASQSSVQEATPGERWMPSLVSSGKMLALSRKVETYPERPKASVSWKNSTVVRSLAMLTVFSVTLACTCATLRVNQVRHLASPVGVSHARRLLSASWGEPFEEQEAGLLFSH